MIISRALPHRADSPSATPAKEPETGVLAPADKVAVGQDEPSFGYRLARKTAAVLLGGATGLAGFTFGGIREAISPHWQLDTKTRSALRGLGAIAGVAGAAYAGFSVLGIAGAALGALGGAVGGAMLASGLAGLGEGFAAGVAGGVKGFITGMGRGAQAGRNLVDWVAGKVASEKPPAKEKTDETAPGNDADRARPGAGDADTGTATPLQGADGERPPSEVGAPGPAGQG